MIEIKINKKKYKLPKEVVDYIHELEYYHNYIIGRRVIEVHSGMTGNILLMCKDYFSIPKEIFPADDKYFESLGGLVLENHKRLQWFIIRREDKPDRMYAFPFVFLRMMPPLENTDDIEENFEGEMASDNENNLID
jgi:hypothetical protein